MKYYKLNPEINVDGLSIVQIGVGQYENGRIAVEAYSIMEDTEDVIEPYGSLSVNLVDQDIPDGVFFARNYSYHVPTHNAMIAAGIIEVVEGIQGEVGMHGICCTAKLTPKATANPV